MISIIQVAIIAFILPNFIFSTNYGNSIIGKILHLITVAYLNTIRLIAFLSAPFLFSSDILELNFDQILAMKPKNQVFSDGQVERKKEKTRR